MSVTPKIFRIALEVGDLDRAADFYGTLLGIAGTRHPGARHYFDCGGVMLALLDPSVGGLTPTSGAKAEASVYFAVENIESVHARAVALNALAPYKVHGASAGDVVTRPWGERSFYVSDQWGNEVCFVQDGTLYT